MADDTLQRLNEAVREHEVSADWEHRDAAATVHAWFDIFNAAFFDGALTRPFVRLERSRPENGGRYREAPNSVGAKNDLVINTRYLELPLPDLLAAVLHSMLHLWQAQFGKPSRTEYHNRQIEARCAALGIPCESRRGCATAWYGDPFVALLRENGVEVTAGPSKPKATASRFTHWGCDCFSFWTLAQVVHGGCDDCGNKFERKSPALHV